MELLTIRVVDLLGNCDNSTPVQTQKILADDRIMSHFPDFSSHGYQVIQELGRNREGGRITYQAIDFAGDRQVVIKQFCFTEAGASWAGFKAYQREIQILRELNHAGIPSYLNSFETASGFCLVQEYKSAFSLADRHSFAADEIKHIAVSVLEILAHLQNRIPPVIHRDIKPENILLEEGDPCGRPQVYLVDFGLARISSGGVATSSVAAGTLGFMPPEQLFNRPLTEASDLYSLGGTLICILTGTASADIGNLINDTCGFNFKHLLPKLNRRFVKWLEKMVAPSAKDRYPDAATALEALQPIEVIRSRYPSFGGVQLVKPAAIAGAVSVVCAIFGILPSVRIDVRPPSTLSSPASTPPPVPKADAAEWLKRGDLLRETQRYSDALAAYNQALKVSDSYAEAWYGRCYALTNLQRPLEALSACDKALNLKQNYAEAWHRRGYALDDLERYSDALQAYDKALQIKPKYDTAWHNRGFTLQKLGRYQEALASYNKSLQFDPNDAVTWQERGRLLDALHRYEQALASFDKAISLKPKSETAWRNRGLTLRKLGRYQEALLSYNKSLELDPNDPMTWQSRGEVLEQLKRLEEAAVSYNKALQFKADYELALQTQKQNMSGSQSLKEKLNP
ncbi:MAG: tetratricopeptide repeat protein [Oscillatoria princeps RMCB-10]|nr:tetratricopeptide repeat protein [Oscillatoria princeps RMCB-10]